MANFNKLYLYRMTHIENIPHILQHGISHITSANANPNFIPIGDSSLINSRNNFVMPNNNTIGNYIPFYFGFKMPMLYVIQNGYLSVKHTNPQDIAYCITSVQQIINHNLDFVFTNGHAVDGLTEFYNADSIANIETLIDKKAVEAKYWRDDKDLDLKRRKEAEFLVANDIPLAAILGYAVYNDTAKNTLLAYGINEEKIAIRPNFYF